MVVYVGLDVNTCVALTRVAFKVLLCRLQLRRTCSILSVPTYVRN